MENKLRNTNLNNKIHSGKVRDIYSLDENLLLFVATDRISAFDVIMNEVVPSKGIILNNLSAFWFNQLENTKTHFRVTRPSGQATVAKKRRRSNDR